MTARDPGVRHRTGLEGWREPCSCVFQEKRAALEYALSRSYLTVNEEKKWVLPYTTLNVTTMTLVLDTHTCNVAESNCKLNENVTAAEKAISYLAK